MFAGVELRVSDMASSQGFYETVLGALGFGARDRAAGGLPLAWGEFALVQASAQATRRLHLGFAACSRAAVDAF